MYLDFPLPKNKNFLILDNRLKTAKALTSKCQSFFLCNIALSILLYHSVTNRLRIFLYVQEKKMLHIIFIYDKMIGIVNI